MPDRGCAVCGDAEAWYAPSTTRQTQQAPLGQRFRVRETSPGPRWWCRRHAEEVCDALNQWEAAHGCTIALTAFGEILSRYGKATL